MINEFMVFVVYEHRADADDRPCFFVGLSMGRAAHSLAGPFQTRAAACAWIETQTIIGQAMATTCLPDGVVILRPFIAMRATDPSQHLLYLVP